MFRGCGRGGMGGMGMGGAGMGGGMRAGRGGMGGRGGRGGQWNWQWPGGAASAWAGPTFEAMMQGWMGEHPQQPGAARDFAAGDHVNAHAEAQASAANAHASAHSAAQAAAEDAHTAAHAAQAAEEAFAAAGMPEGSGEEYLQRVGDFVAAALDPLGIDVQVDVETPGGQRTTVKPSAKTDKAEEDEQDKAASPEAAKEGSASSSDDEEWTVLSDKKPEAE